MARIKGKHHTSSNSEKDPYLKISFWVDESSHFWECDLYSEESKQYFRNWLNKMVKKAKYLPSIDSNLN